jgi:hypothetical protein
MHWQVNVVCFVVDHVLDLSLAYETQSGSKDRGDPAVGASNSICFNIVCLFHI